MSAIDYIILALMAAVLVVLVMGVIQMMRGNDPARSNRLMMWRVVLQGAIILLLAVFLAKH